MGQPRPKNNQEKIDPVEQKALKDAMDNFYKNRAGNDVNQVINPAGAQQPTPLTAPVATQPPIMQTTQAPPTVNMNGFQDMNSFEKSAYAQQAANIDPNLNVEFEVIKFPSKGLYYPSKISEVVVEKMTSRDEDILSTGSLIENGTVLDVLIKNKVKNNAINTDELLVGDRNAILLFLRASSYGQDYDVRVADPRTGNIFPAIVDLTKLKAKEIIVVPDERGEFSFQLPVRKVLVKFRVLNYREINSIVKAADARQEAYGTEFSEFGSLKLKSEVVEIEGNRNKDYIHQFIDAMPAKDSGTLKQKIQEVTPDVDMNYEFKTTDGFTFKSKISVGVDFFFPFI